MSEKESESAQVYVAPELTEQKYDLDQIVFDLDAQMDLLSSHADGGDYLAAIGSGLICGILDVVWGGAFDLRRGREWSSSQTVSAPRNSVLAKPSLPVRKSFHGVAVYF